MSPRGPYTFRLESIKMPRAKSLRSYRRFDEVNPYATPRKFVVRSRTLARSGPASRSAGDAEEEGTIRGQIKTRRVTVEWVRNERVCDFGHAVRLYVDLRSTGGTERSGEKEEKKRRRGEWEKERKREGKGVRRDREDSIYSAFVPPLLPVERALRLASIRTRSLPLSERQAEERRQNADTFEGKDEETAWKRDRETLREREREAAEAERRERVGDTSWRLRTHSSRERQAARQYTRLCVYAGKRKRKKEREGEKLILRVRWCTSVNSRRNFVANVGKAVVTAAPCDRWKMYHKWPRLFMRRRISWKSHSEMKFQPKEQMISENLARILSKIARKPCR